MKHFTEKEFMELYDLNSLDGGISSAILLSKSEDCPDDLPLEADIPIALIRLAELDFKDPTKKDLKVVVLMKDIADANQQVVYVKLPSFLVEPTIVYNSHNLRAVEKKINASFIDVSA